MGMDAVILVATLAECKLVGLACYDPAMPLESDHFPIIPHEATGVQCCGWCGLKDA